MTTLTHSGTTATATMGSNVYTVGQSVTISGASPSAYDGTFTVTAVNTTSHTFSYTMTSTPGSNASGSDMVVTTPSDTLDGAISRVSALMDHAGTSAGVHLEEYAYLGLDTTVILNRPEDNTELTYVTVPSSIDDNTDGGDSYTGLDRFGRVIDQYWLNTASSPNAVDRFQYGYDRDGNVLYENNLGPNGSSGAPSTQAAAFSQLYHANSTTTGDDSTAYDPLGRLTNMRRGTLSASTNNGGVPDTVTTLNSTTGITDDSASWSLNAVGGWSSVTTDGTSSSHTDNAQNEITAVGTTGLTYDNNGNLTKNDQGYTLTYDAWNRLMTSSDQSLKMQYDALGRYDHENYASGINELYYDNEGHQIEVYDNGVYTQYVWGLAYVNELILRDKDADGTSTGNYGVAGSHLEQRLYAEFDANYDVTSLYQVNGTPGIAERIIYDPYGKTQLLTASWASSSSSTLFFRVLYQGEYQLSEANVYIMGARMYDYTLGAWDQKDPAGYATGADPYQFAVGAPAEMIDPSGLAPFDLGGWGDQAVKSFYTGDPNASDDALNAGFSAAGDWLYNDSPVRGGYALVGPQQGNTINRQVGVGGAWDMDSGYSVGAEGYLSLQDPNNIGWMGAGGWWGYNQDQGFGGGQGVFVGNGSHMSSEYGEDNQGTTYFGLNYKWINFGLMLDKSKFPNLYNYYKHWWNDEREADPQPVGSVCPTRSQGQGPSIGLPSSYGPSSTFKYPTIIVTAPPWDPFDEPPILSLFPLSSPSPSPLGWSLNGSSQPPENDISGGSQQFNASVEFRL